MEIDEPERLEISTSVKSATLEIYTFFWGTWRIKRGPKIMVPKRGAGK